MPENTSPVATDTAAPRSETAQEAVGAEELIEAAAHAQQVIAAADRTLKQAGMAVGFTAFLGLRNLAGPDRAGGKRTRLSGADRRALLKQGLIAVDGEKQVGLTDAGRRVISEGEQAFAAHVAAAGAGPVAFSRQRARNLTRLCRRLGRYLGRRPA